jgi:hypothetical protein
MRAETIIAIVFGVTAAFTPPVGYLLKRRLARDQGAFFPLHAVLKGTEYSRLLDRDYSHCTITVLVLLGAW